MDISTLSIIIFVFLLAGTVKGVIGLGLPTVSLAILTIAMDLTSAMALLLIPSFVKYSSGDMVVVLVLRRPFSEENT